MSMNLNPTTRLVDMTLADLQEWLRANIQEIIPTQTAKVVMKEVPEKKKNYVYGITGLMELFNLSRTTVYRKLLQTHIIDDAITRVAGKLIIDADMAVKLVKKNGKEEE